MKAKKLLKIVPEETTMEFSAILVIDPASSDNHL
jgi:hypothetical protein